MQGRQNLVASLDACKYILLDNKDKAGGFCQCYSFWAFNTCNRFARVCTGQGGMIPDQVREREVGQGGRRLVCILSMCRLTQTLLASSHGCNALVTMRAALSPEATAPSSVALFSISVCSPAKNNLSWTGRNTVFTFSPSTVCVGSNHLN